ncbi:hypothetical protein ACQP1V_39525 [Microtetraspora malaysiensis]|uniref:hypothetical protein n=1 Tax=Microtetraspora malaysiensis TaxID=161358 RepID=UPI003D908432
MLVVLALAAIAVVAVTVKVSQGHGGEMAVFPPDTPPLVIPRGRLYAADLARLQLPIGLVGYQTDAVDATLQRVAASLGERDLHIAALEQRLAELVTARLYGRPSDAEEPRSGVDADDAPLRTDAAALWADAADDDPMDGATAAEDESAEDEPAEDEPAAGDASGDGASADEDRDAPDATSTPGTESADDAPQTEQPEQPEHERVGEPAQAERLGKPKPAESEQAESRDRAAEQPGEGAEPRRAATATATATIMSTGTREEGA